MVTYLLPGQTGMGIIGEIPYEQWSSNPQLKSQAEDFWRGLGIDPYNVPSGGIRVPGIPPPNVVTPFGNQTGGNNMPINTGPFGQSSNFPAPTNIQYYNQQGNPFDVSKDMNWYYKNPSGEWWSGGVGPNGLIGEIQVTDTHLGDFPWMANPGAGNPNYILNDPTFRNRLNNQMMPQSNGALLNNVIQNDNRATASQIIPGRGFGQIQPSSGVVGQRAVGGIPGRGVQQGYAGYNPTNTLNALLQNRSGYQNKTTPEYPYQNGQTGTMLDQILRQRKSGYLR